MPTPRREHLRVVGRDRFIRRMFYATGIFPFAASEIPIVREVQDISLDSAERLRYILFLWNELGSIFYFKDTMLLSDYNIFVRRYARHGEVEDWVGIP
ncbi:MAG: hypothetical protein QXP58_07015 [Thermoprotei archaeon]